MSLGIIQKQPPKCFVKKFSNIRRKTSVLESLFNKAAVLQTSNFIKKRLQHRCFSVNIAKYLRTPILKNFCKWLLLMIFNLFLKIWDFEFGDSYKLISYKRKSVNKVHIRDGYKLYYAVTERNRFIFNQTFELN